MKCNTNSRAAWREQSQERKSVNTDKFLYISVFRLSNYWTVTNTAFFVRFLMFPWLNSLLLRCSGRTVLPYSIKESRPAGGTRPATQTKLQRTETTASVKEAAAAGAEKQLSFKSCNNLHQRKSLAVYEWPKRLTTKDRSEGNVELLKLDFRHENVEIFSYHQLRSRYSERMTL